MSDKPKRPMSSFMLWLNSSRESIKADHPGVGVTEIAKIGGEIWRGMPDKREWEEKAAKAKEQYTKALENFNANGGDGDNVGKKLLRRGKKVEKKTPTSKSKKKRQESDDDDEEDEDDEDDEETESE